MTNVNFLILCLKTIIDMIEPIVPPTKEEKSSLFSDTLVIFREFFNDCNLS